MVSPPAPSGPSSPHWLFGPPERALPAPTHFRLWLHLILPVLVSVTGCGFQKDEEEACTISFWFLTQVPEVGIYNQSSSTLPKQARWKLLIQLPPAACEHSPPFFIAQPYSGPTGWDLPQRAWAALPKGLLGRDTLFRKRWLVTERSWDPPLDNFMFLAWGHGALGTGSLSSEAGSPLTHAAPLWKWA